MGADVVFEAMGSSSERWGMKRGDSSISISSLSLSLLSSSASLVLMGSADADLGVCILGLGKEVLERACRCSGVGGVVWVEPILYVLVLAAGSSEGAGSFGASGGFLGI